MMLYTLVILGIRVEPVKADYSFKIMILSYSSFALTIFSRLNAFISSRIRKWSIFCQTFEYRRRSQWLIKPSVYCSTETPEEYVYEMMLGRMASDKERIV